jgi:hypothetical protein
VIKQLLSKHEALNSNPTTANEKRERKEKGRKEGRERKKERERKKLKYSITM